MPITTPLSPNEIRDRALKFAHEWQGERRERGEAQTFWNEFFSVFGVSRRRVASFEEPVRRARQRMAGDTLKHAGHAKGEGGFIDLLWKGTLIAEHKSAGKDLDTAYEQALEYFEGLPERDLPRYVIVSDFARFRLYDLDEKQQHDFPLADLHKRIGLFGFIAGYTTQRIREQDPVNIKAAEKMGRLHDQLKASGYAGHDLEVLLVRLLFCLFAEDTTIFDQKGMFRDWLETCTREDGSDLGAQLELLFQVLNKPEDKRQKNLDERFAAFPYVNGKLFEERLNVAAFTSGMRGALLDCCALDWGRISPAIFGALFQSVMDEKARRNLGAHYTSEKNILKLVKSLFLDELRTEFEKAKSNRNRLFELHKKIAALKFLDPACGCGNFLVIAYRELRLLELDILRAMLRFEQEGGQRVMDVVPLINVNVDQFYGIELEEFPAQIAQVALWLMDHQMNMRVSEEFGFYYRRLPLTHAATIRCANALKIDWNEVISAEQVDYILGNPPFVGKHYRSPQQRDELIAAFQNLKAAGDLDYVAAWYIKAVRYLRDDGFNADLLAGLGGTSPKDRVKIAFVSTNSITQGEQVPVLWPELFKLGVHIHFAHRTFQWSNEASGVAAVHCVIIGFGLTKPVQCALFEYAQPRGEAHMQIVASISPYLTPGPETVIAKRQQPLNPDLPIMRCGNKPSDGGHLLLTPEERTELLNDNPGASKFIHRYVGSEEFINNIERYCLWLIDATPTELRAMPAVMKRVEAVQKFRTASSAEPTRKSARTPTRFFFVSQPDRAYILIPEVSSERRHYIPMGFMSADVISSNTNFITPSSSLFEYGVLQSTMHMAWVRCVGGRLESRYRYSASMLYNTFPWPLDATGNHMEAIESAAQAVLDVRKQFPESSLADLYDPVAMPPVLRAAHAVLDRAVDAAYGKRNFNSDAERVAFLFDLYQKYTTLLPAAEKPKRYAKPKS